MYLFQICFIFVFVSCNEGKQINQIKPIIKNMDFHSCKNCVYYKPNSNSKEFTSTTSTCKMFGEKDITTNKITHYYADLCRKDESLCGTSGTYFEKEKYINLKITKHNIVYQLPQISLVLFISFIIYLRLYVVYFESIP